MFESNKVFRPHLDDVERLSFGKGAKRNRGTGSRDVCHRLNRDERTSYDLAKKAGYLTVRGSGYRKERKGSPLCNTYRQRCDALEEICIIIEKRSDQDMIVIDFSTLRVVDDAQFVSLVVKNVFQAKYPDLQLDIENQDVKTSVAAPIEWDAVKTKPIWGVNERLITVDCDRDVAKALAIDILKEIKGFDNIDIEQIETVHHCDEVVVDAGVVEENVEQIATAHHCDEVVVDADVVEEVREAVNEIDYS